jgi:hypothetical protein
MMSASNPFRLIGISIANQRLLFVDRTTCPLQPITYGLWALALVSKAQEPPTIQVGEFAKDEPIEICNVLPGLSPCRHSLRESGG